MMQIIERTVDLNKSWEKSGITPQEIRLRRGEHGLIKLRIRVTDNSVAYDLTGCSVRFCCQYKGGQFVRAAVEVNEGAAELIVTERFTAVPGRAAVSYLEVTQDGNVIDTDTLPIYIMDNVDISSGEAAEYRSEIDDIKSEMEATRAEMLAQKSEFDRQEQARQTAEDARDEAERKRQAAEDAREKKIAEVDEALTTAQQAIEDANAAVDGAAQAAVGATTAAASAQSAADAANSAAEDATSAARFADAATQTVTDRMADINEAEQAREDAESARESWYTETKQAVDDGAFDGATYTPALDDEGNLSWSNDKDKPNPETKNIKGPKGDKGDQGEGLNILDAFDSLEAIQAAHTDNNQIGDAYMGGTHYYTWNGSEWKDCGELQGAKGDPGSEGPPGKDGTSVTHEWDGTTLSITSASGTSSADLRGPEGPPGPPGETVTLDELTDADIDAAFEVV